VKLIGNFYSFWFVGVAWFWGLTCDFAEGIGRKKFGGIWGLDRRATAKARVWFGKCLLSPVDWWVGEGGQATQTATTTATARTWIGRFLLSHPSR
jgi:hypothetical protein